MKEKRDYKVIAALGNVELPEGFNEIAFSDFSIKECPNHAEPTALYDEDGSVTDVDWNYPQKPDPRFPVCDYYLEKLFKAEGGWGWQKAEWELSWALTRLRLSNRGRLWGSIYRVYDIAHPGIREGIGDISESHKRRPKEPPSPPRLFMRSHYAFKIDEGNINSLQNFVKEMRNAPTKHFEIAIRRFHQSFDRDFPEDQALDLFIALESLFSEGPEAIGYKIALRAAHLISDEQDEKAQINSYLKDAYNKRSHIIHGRTQALKWFKEKSYSGHTNLDELEDITRRALRVILDKARAGIELKPEDLDKTLFFGEVT